MRRCCWIAASTVLLSVSVWAYAQNRGVVVTSPPQATDTGVMLPGSTCSPVLPDGRLAPYIVADPARADVIVDGVPFVAAPGPPCLQSVSEGLILENSTDSQVLPSRAGNKVLQNSVFEENFFHDIAPGMVGWDGLWWIDYNATIWVCFVPDPSSYGGYKLVVTIQPYMVKVAWGGSFHWWTNYKEEYADFGTPLGGSAIEIKSRGVLYYPGGSQSFPEYSHGNYYTVQRTWTGAGIVGAWSITVELWNSYSKSWVGRSFSFKLADADTYNTNHQGYLVASGLLTAYSDYGTLNNQYVKHHAGTLEYYLNKRTVLLNETVKLTQYWQRVRRANNHAGYYGCPYASPPTYDDPQDDWAPNRIVYTSLQWAGNSDTWDLVPFPVEGFRGVMRRPG